MLYILDMAGTGTHRINIRGRIMMRIYNDITETIGNTPLVKINKLNIVKDVTLLAKLEFFNPMSSIKDRLGLALIEAGEKQGLVNKNTTIIEPTSGNTGIGIAFVCAERGYRAIITMPDTMSIERRKLLQVLGAEVVLTDGVKGMQGAIDRAEELHRQIPDSFIPQQFRNPANPEVHRRTTAVEIWNDTDGSVDIVIGGVGTGGTISGIGEALKKKKSSVRIIAVEPADSPVLSGGAAGPHQIQGIGAGFVPEVFNRKAVDEIITVSHTDAGNTAHRLAKEEGILIGISGGAALYAALKICERKESQDKTIVVIIPDSGERYISTWLFDNL